MWNGENHPKHGIQFDGLTTVLSLHRIPVHEKTVRILKQGQSYFLLVRYWRPCVRTSKGSNNWLVSNTKPLVPNCNNIRRLLNFQHSGYVLIQPLK